MKRDYTESLINKIFKQGETGVFKIGETSPWTFFVKFENELSEKSNNGEISVRIKAKDRFIESISKYLLEARKFYAEDKEYYELGDESFDEKLLMDLFVNATNFDFNNIDAYILNRTKMLKDEVTQETEISLTHILDAEIKCKITKNRSNLESPYKFTPYIANGDDEFVLPSISFGRIGNDLHIYSIQGKREKQTTAVAKKFDRYFRKVNSGIDSEDEILSQVSPNALVALTIFFAYQKNLGVDNVVAYNFMPIRYESKVTTSLNKAKTEEEKTLLLDGLDRNQYNISNRFYNTILRYAHHFEMETNFDEVCERLSLELKETNVKSENIIVEIDANIKNSLLECEVNNI